MNYDGYADAIIVVYNKEERVVATEMVKAFYVVDLMDTLFFVRLLRKDNAMGYYQRLIAGDKLTLYKKVSISLETATSSGTRQGKHKLSLLRNMFFIYNVIPCCQLNSRIKKIF